MFLPLFDRSSIVTGSGVGERERGGGGGSAKVRKLGFEYGMPTLYSAQRK